MFVQIKNVGSRRGGFPRLCSSADGILSYSRHLHQLRCFEVLISNLYNILLSYYSNLFYSTLLYSTLF